MQCAICRDPIINATNHFVNLRCRFGHVYHLRCHVSALSNTRRMECLLCTKTASSIIDHIDNVNSFFNRYPVEERLIKIFYYFLLGDINVDFPLQNLTPSEIESCFFNKCAHFITRGFSHLPICSHDHHALCNVLQYHAQRNDTAYASNMQQHLLSTWLAFVQHIITTLFLSQQPEYARGLGVTRAQSPLGVAPLALGADFSIQDFLRQRHSLFTHPDYLPLIDAICNIEVGLDLESEITDIISTMPMRFSLVDLAEMRRMLITVMATTLRISPDELLQLKVNSDIPINDVANLPIFLTPLTFSQCYEKIRHARQIIHAHLSETHCMYSLCALFCYAASIGCAIIIHKMDSNLLWTWKIIFLLIVVLVMTFLKFIIPHHEMSQIKKELAHLKREGITLSGFASDDIWRRFKTSNIFFNMGIAQIVVVIVYLILYTN